MIHQSKVLRTVEEVLMEVKRVANTFPEIEKVVLFGSRARGDNKYNSDIDLCVFAPMESFDSFLKFSQEVDDIFTHFSFDVLFFPRLNNEVLIHDILTEGVVL